MNQVTIDSKTNIVTNLSVPAPEGHEWTPPDGSYTVLSDVARIGDTYSNGQFVSPSTDQE